MKTLAEVHFKITINKKQTKKKTPHHISKKFRKLQVELKKKKKKHPDKCTAFKPIKAKMKRKS